MTSSTLAVLLPVIIWHTVTNHYSLQQCTQYIQLTAIEVSSASDSPLEASDELELLGELSTGGLAVV